jgi:hypothetical protein
MLSLETILSLLPLGGSRSFPSAFLLQEVFSKIAWIIALTLVGGLLGAVLMVTFLYGLYRGAVMAGIPDGIAGMGVWILALAVLVGLFYYMKSVVLSLSYLPQKLFPPTESPLAPLTHKMGSMTGAFMQGLMSGGRK